MANFVHRRCLRIRNLKKNESGSFLSDLQELCALEKITAQDDTVCVYVPVQLKEIASKTSLDLLNRYEGYTKYKLGDIEVHTTIVVITNIPKQFKEEEMNSLLSGFGKLLTKFECLRWKDNKRYPSKFGWVVYEELHSAELCVQKLSKMKIAEHYLKAGLLSSNITSISCMQEIKTIQIEGFPRTWDEDKIREILMLLCPEVAQHAVKYIKTEEFEVDDLTRYIALIDWDTPKHAFLAFQKLDGFQAALKTGSLLCDIKASFALPGCSAFESFCQTLGVKIESSNSSDSDRENTLNHKVEEKDSRTYSPPPPYESRSRTSLLTSNVPLTMVPPPPYTSPVTTAQQAVPRIQACRNKNNSPRNIQQPLLSQIVAAPQAPLNQQQLYERVIRQGCQMSYQQFCQLSTQDALRLAGINNAVIQGRIQPPPPVTPTQTYIIQDGRSVVVPFSNHFPPLPQVRPRPNPPPIRQKAMLPRPHHHVVRLEKTFHQCKPKASVKLTNSPKESKEEIPISCPKNEQNVNQTQPIVTFDSNQTREKSRQPVERGYISPSVNPWSNKKANPRRWSEAKKCKAPQDQLQQHRPPMKPLVEEPEAKEENRVANQQSKQYEEKMLSQVDENLSTTPDGENKSCLLTALTRLSFIDSENMKQISDSNVMNIWPWNEGDNSRLLAFKISQKEKDGVWKHSSKPIPKETFRKLF